MLGKHPACCELLSFCIFALLTTVFFWACGECTRLWIAFILYLCFVDNSCSIIFEELNLVVNCFHFVSLLCWQQYKYVLVVSQIGCELLSFCIFALLTTVKQTYTNTIIPLWIAFILYLCFVDNSSLILAILSCMVVNCFHFVSLLCWQQSFAN